MTTPRSLLTIDTLGTRHERHNRATCAIFTHGHLIADCTCGAQIIWPEQSRPGRARRAVTRFRGKIARQRFSEDGR